MKHDKRHDVNKTQTSVSTVVARTTVRRHANKKQTISTEVIRVTPLDTESSKNRSTGESVKKHDEPGRKSREQTRARRCRDRLARCSIDPIKAGGDEPRPHMLICLKEESVVVVFVVA